MEKVDKDVELEFKWGKKRGIGGKKKDVQFYESFTYDGVDYTLYDCVYLHKDGEPEPYIGKLIKIWENRDKSKKVKVQWFFRPCEILNFLEANETLDNELFLATGDGIGLSNVNPLEAIAGKCNVICISKHSQNPQPSNEELQMADFVFYRYFDVGHHKILDNIDDKIAGIEVKNIFNNLDSQKPVDVVKLGLDQKGDSGNVTASNEVVALSSKDNSQPIVVKVDGTYVDTLARENADYKPSLGELSTSSVGVKEASKSNDGLQSISSDKTLPQAKVKENGVSKASLVKQKSCAKQSYGSRVGLGMGQKAKTDNRLGNISIEKTTLRCNVDSKGGEGEVVGGPIKQVEAGLDVKFTKDNKGLGEERASKKEKVGDSIKVSIEKHKNSLQKKKPLINDDDIKSVAPNVISSKHKYKLQRAKDFCVPEEVPSKKLKLEKKPTKLSRGKLHKESSTESPKMERKLDCRAMEITRRPNADRSRWFKGFPWEERMKSASKQGTLVLLENLDPSLTSQEVEDIIWHGFEESCTAKVIQETAFSSPHSGQAFVIFKRKEAAELVVKKLDEGCFLLSNGRSLVGSIGHPCFPEKKPIFYGHHVVDQLRMQMQREMKDAVSTSHCSQPNNIEYDMAMEWCLLQERTEKAWRKLYQRQGEELRKLKEKLKSK